ncbi:MAG: hypothetical protein ABIO24_12945, partial [Saprospiraceae bacterium]
MLLALLVVCVALSGAAVGAEGRLKPGDPPIAALISVSQPDADGNVTISGAAGAVFPAAQLAIRNLYTGDTVYTLAGITGTFTAILYGPNHTPFWISPAPNIPIELRDKPGSLPGGPGTIVYDGFSQTPTQSAATTQISIDGDFSDWDGYSSSALATGSEPAVHAFLNTNSIYVAITGSTIPADYAHIDIEMTIDGTDHSVVLDPRGSGSGDLSRGQPTLRPAGTFALAAAQAAAIEVRMPLDAFLLQQNPTIEQVILRRVRFLAADGTELSSLAVDKPLPLVNEADGITRVANQSAPDSTRFTLSGTLGGNNRWQAQGRINALTFKAGDTVTLQMDVQMDAPTLPVGLVGLKMLGRLRLQPILGADGTQVGGGLNSNNGWSDIRTASGLAISNLRSDFQLAETTTQPNQIVRQDGKILFPLDFTVQLPADLPAGLYVPLLAGFGQVEDGDVFAWQDNGPLGTGATSSTASFTRLPVTMKVGDVPDGHLFWTLFQDNPSDGSRGVVAVEDQAKYALSNRVHFDSPTYILPKT